MSQNRLYYRHIILSTLQRPSHTSETQHSYSLSWVDRTCNTLTHTPRFPISKVNKPHIHSHKSVIPYLFSVAFLAEKAAHGVVIFIINCGWLCANATIFGPLFGRQFCAICIGTPGRIRGALTLHDIGIMCGVLVMNGVEDARGRERTIGRSGTCMLWVSNFPLSTDKTCLGLNMF